MVNFNAYRTRAITTSRDLGMFRRVLDPLVVEVYVFMMEVILLQRRAEDYKMLPMPTV